MKREFRQKTVAAACVVAMTMGLALPAFGAEAALPDAKWQAEVSFPDWMNQIEPSLVANNQYSFYGYHDQGKLYVTAEEGVTGFTLFVNNRKVDTAQVEPGETYCLDISDLTVDGTNILQVSDVQPAEKSKSIKINIPYPEVMEGGNLEEEGLDQQAFDIISDIVQSDIDYGFSSAQLAVIRNGQLVYQNAWGKLNSYEKDGTPKTDSADVTNDTLYDLASNTKMYSVNYAIQYLVTYEGFNLDAKIVDLIGENFVEDTIDLTYDGYENPGLETQKEWKSELTVRDILRHQGGFPADPRYNSDVINGEENALFSGYDGSAETKQKTLESICKTPLMYEPGTKTVYSDVDYMLLAFIVEKTVGEDLDTWLDKTFYEPLGLEHMTYNPLENGFTVEDCAATELYGNTRAGAVDFTGIRTETLQGEVHDEKAYYAMGGVSGHAGLFSNATDLAKLASVMLTGGYGEHRFFSRNVMDTFTAPKKEDDSFATYGLGWWREADTQRAKYFGVQSSSDTIGHQGWTGTLTMIEPEKNLVVAFLTNKINTPVRDPKNAPNMFNGNYYTSSTLGFVNALIETGMDADPQADLDQVYSALLEDMVNDKLRLVAAEEKAGTELDADHPIVKAAYSIINVLFLRAEKTGSEEDWSRCSRVLEQLDSQRDQAEIEKFEARLQK